MMMASVKNFLGQSLPVEYCKGTHYDVGYFIGHTFARRINDWFDDTRSPLCFFRKFYDDPEGNKIVKKYLEAAEKMFPEYVQEMRGIAEGSGAAFTDILLQNLMSEIEYAHKEVGDKIRNSVQREVREVNGCTTVYVNRNGLRLIGHNEDAEVGMERYQYLVEATLVDETDHSNVKENFISFMYPGMIPGFAFSVTNRFVITGNSLVPRAFCPNGVPLGIVLRKMLSCKTMEEIVEVAKCKPYGCSYGFSLNIASIQDTGMWCLEMLPSDKGTDVYLHNIPVAADTSEKCHYFHQNFYKHVDTEELPIIQDTHARGKRCDDLPSPRNVGDVRRILGDTGNENFPIYKSMVESDTGAKTVCTALLNVTEKELNMYLDNPTDKQPFATLPFP